MKITHWLDDIVLTAEDENEEYLLDILRDKLANSDLAFEAQLSQRGKIFQLIIGKPITKEKKTI